jgi:hypothetical protein
MFGTVRTPDIGRTPDGHGAVAAPVEDPALVPLAELASEFGWDSPLITTPRDAIDVLAGRFAGEVVLDDLGRRCVSREVARRLFAERAAAEAKARKAWERREVELAEQAAANPVWPGIPAGPDSDGATAVARMLAAARDALPKRQSVLEHALQDRDGAIEYFPIEQP